MRRERNELAEYMNLMVIKDTDSIQFWLDNKSVLPKLKAVYSGSPSPVCASIFSCQRESM